MKTRLAGASGTRIPSLACLALIVIAGNAAAAQNQEPAAPGLQQHPLAALMKSQPGTEYELGAGDEISVTVIGRPELSVTQTVGPDGEITVPVVGSVVVENLSRTAAALSIADSLKALYANPSVTVEVKKYTSNHVLLIGNVEHPGDMAFEDTPTLLKAISRGGALIGADKSERMPESCIIYRGKDQVGTINLKEVMHTGDIRLHRGDIIYVPGDQDKLISVLGEVKNPGPVPLRQDSTLISLLAYVGNITPNAGNPTIQIINPTTGAIQKVKYQDLIKAKGTEVTLAVGDIVYVPRSGIASVGYVLQQIAPAASLGTIAALAAQ